ncbi:MAG: sugar transferase [Candidatus Methylomirabilis sp.]|nr:sugar transferase [Candidatus Methylomirabilis sp.]
MVSEADRLFGPRQATEDDPRVTRVGRILRATAMDEITPALEYFPGRDECRWTAGAATGGDRGKSPMCTVQRSTREVTALEQVPGYWQRHLVPPGLTGIAQIFADRDIPSRQKFRYDLLYIRRQSFWLDLRLVAISFWVTFRGRWEMRGRSFRDVQGSTFNV